MSGLRGDDWIRRMAEAGMITPFVRGQIRECCGVRVISYGVSSYGYDLRVADEFRVFTNIRCGVVDPKAMNEQAFVSVEGAGFVLVPPNSFVLARSIERFSIPPNVLGIVLGKSTYARCGIIVNCTPLEPGWRGYLTIEISNTTPLPAKVYANEGIAQVIFFESPDRCGLTYADRPDAKYQDQAAEPTLPRV